MSPTQRGAGSWHGFAIEGDMHTCWLCQRPVSAQALRCPQCGALQPLHETNHFALLGLEQRFDLDLETLDRHYASARRTLDPERVAVKTPKAGALARHYIDLMAVAFETLKNPVTRARYLLELLDADAVARGDEPAVVGELPAANHNGVSHDELDDLARAIADATDASSLDRLGARAVGAIEGCIHSLSTAFRAGRTGEARLALAHLDRLEPLAAEARRRRQSLCPPKKYEP
ncbi:MAG: molecular chaperone DnaJ [Rhodospirillaceae bacterium]